MADLKVRNVPDSVISQLDALAFKKKTSRNQIILDALTAYSTAQDENFCSLLPKIIESETKEELKYFEKIITDSIEMILACCLKLNKSSDRLNDFLFPELEKITVEGMDSEQILAIISGESNEKNTVSDAESAAEDSDEIIF